MVSFSSEKAHHTSLNLQMKVLRKKKWGYLRETKEKALKAGIDPESNLERTGLEEYLAVIFPHVNDWVHDKPIGILNGRKSRLRPDYRSESLKMIVEFDGLPHYTNPRNILEDKRKTELYEKDGYKVIRIPYFIQLSNEVVKALFDIDVKTPLFDEQYSSLGIKGRNTPAFLCTLGIERMAKEFLKFPSQLKVNMDHLKIEASTGPEEDVLSGHRLLENQLKLISKKG